MHRRIVLFILVQIILFKKFQVICQLETEVRLMNGGNCNMSGLLWTIHDISIHSQYPKTYVNLRLNLNEEIKNIKKIYVHLERCNEQGFDCTDFQNLSMERFCSLILTKNQIWSGLHDHSKPPLRCPLKKISYEIRNSTVDIDVLTRFYPEVVKYCWNANIKLTNEQDKIVFCGNFKVQMFQYRKRNRKPRNNL